MIFFNTFIPADANSDVAQQHTYISVAALVGELPVCREHSFLSSTRAIACHRVPTIPEQSCNISHV